MQTKWNEPVGNLDAIKKLKTLINDLSRDQGKSTYIKMKKDFAKKTLAWLERNIVALEGEVSVLRQEKLQKAELNKDFIRPEPDAPEITEELGERRGEPEGSDIP